MHVHINEVGYQPADEFDQAWRECTLAHGHMFNWMWMQWWCFT